MRFVQRGSWIYAFQLSHSKPEKGSALSRLKFLLDGAHRGAWNMAVDEALLDSDEPCFLRVYRWEPAALSLGYFQKLDATELIPFREAGIDIVRRLTGGGAILHAHELTYSLTGTVGEAPFDGIIEASYRCVHNAWISALAEIGLQARSADEAPRVLSHSEQPFLCFARSTRLDVVAGERKLIGSAKRERRGRALQHGSVILEAHEQGGVVASVNQLATRPFTPDQLATSFAQKLATSLGKELTPSQLPQGVASKVAIATGPID